MRTVRRNSVHLICLALALQIIYVHCSKATSHCASSERDSNNCNCTLRTSALQTFENKVLKRRTRALLFIKRTDVIFNGVYVTSITGARPTSLMFYNVIGLAYPLPDTVDATMPKIILERIEQDKKEKEAKLAAEEALKEEEAELAAEEAAKAEEEEEKARKAEEAQKLLSTSFIYNSADELADYEKYHYAFDEQNYNAAPIINQRYDDYWKYNNKRIYKPQQFRKGNIMHNPSNNYWSHYKPNMHKLPQRKQSDRSYQKYANYYKPKLVTKQRKTAEEMPTWRHHPNYRERRDLFDVLAALGDTYNINGKSCIQRAMCEVTNLLTPYGESLMADWARILLTMPDDVVIDDDYAQMAQQFNDKTNCALKFSVNCPYPILEYFTKNMPKLTAAN